MFYFVIANLRGHKLARICYSLEEIDAVKEALGREGIPCSSGWAESVGNAGDNLRDIIGLPPTFLHWLDERG